MKKRWGIILCVCLLVTCSALSLADEYTVKVSSPSGAPGLALATLAVEHPEDYTYVTAETITAEFANQTADFIIAPLNAGAKLYKAGKSTYKLAAVVCWGNLYFASQKADFALMDMDGRTVTLFGENTINASIALYVLQANGITPATVEYLAGAANTQSLLLSDPDAIVLTAEPALTAASIKNEAVTGFAVNDLYKEATGYEGYTQAGLFVRQQTLEEHQDAVKAFLEKAESACENCTSDVAAVAEAAVALEILPNQKVAMSAIPNCAIRYLSASQAKEQVEITANIDLSQFGGSVPADDFYYAAE